MEKQIVLTISEVNEILGILSDLPIKYITLVDRIQVMFRNKFNMESEVEKNALYPSEP